MTDREIKHVVVTRFNLAIRFGCTKREDSTVPHQRPWLDIDYLDKRFDIFERYTFLAMKQQTEMNYEWLVLFHKETPERYRQKIREYQNELSTFTPLYFDDEQCMNLGGALRDYLEEKYREYDMITTRLDNDDYVHPQFIEHIQNDLMSLKQEENIILSYENGIQYDIRSRDVLRYDYWKNHFISLLDVSGQKKHVLNYNHDAIDEAEIQVIRKKTEFPLWAEIITVSNYSNFERWTFGAPFISCKVTKWYPEFLYKWDTPTGYAFYVGSAVIKMFMSKTVNFCKLILHH